MFWRKKITWVRIPVCFDPVHRMEATGGPHGEAGQGLAARASPTAQAGSRAGPGTASTLGTGNLPGAWWGCGPAAGPGSARGPGQGGIAGSGADSARAWNGILGHGGAPGGLLRKSEACGCPHFLLGWCLKNQHPQNTSPLLLHDLSPKSCCCSHPALPKAEPSFPEQIACNHLLGLVPLSHGWQMWWFIPETQHYSAKTLVQAVLRAEATHSWASGGAGAPGGVGGGGVSEGPPACPVTGEPSCLAQKTHHPTPLPDSKV